MTDLDLIRVCGGYFSSPFYTRSIFELLLVKRENLLILAEKIGDVILRAFLMFIQ